MKSTSNFNTEVCRLSIGSKKLVYDLIDKCLSPRKSLSIHPWEGEKHLMRHYWRGIIDGDGSVAKNKTSNVWRVSLNSNINMISGFSKFLNDYGINNCGHAHRHGRIYKISYAGTNLPYKIVSILYDNCEVALERKLKTAKDLVYFCNSKQTNCPTGIE